MLSKLPRPRKRPEADNLFAWTVFIVCLAFFAVFCWVGSFYVFGHPEKGLSYSLLKKFGKIDAPKRFEDTSAPRGNFLTADDLHSHFNPMANSSLQAESDRLLRNYVRNYEQTKDRVQYVVGEYRVMGVFRLAANNFFPSGVVALAESAENPHVLLEMVFPAAAGNTPELERLLQTGLGLQLVKTHDLTAVIGARKLPDDRLSLTVVPLLYGNYTSSTANGTFSLEPPEELNADAGLPILNQAAVDAADENFRIFASRTGLVRKETPAVLMRVQRTEAVAAGTEPKSEETAPVPRAVAVDKADVPVARAVPVSKEPPRAEPVATPPEVRVAEPVAPAPVQPTPAAASATAAPARQWTLHQPGEMPRGRLVELESTRGLAGALGTERTYLRGDFKVTASGSGRAVLRGGTRDVRVIADFPDGSPVPAEGDIFRRDSQRPFEITAVEQEPDGQISVYVREVTRP